MGECQVIEEVLDQDFISLINLHRFYLLLGPYSLMGLTVIGPYSLVGVKVIEVFNSLFIIFCRPSLTQCLQDLSSAGDCALVAAASSSPAPSPPSPLITSAQPYSVSDVHHHHHHTGDVDLSSPAADNLKRNIPENNRSRKRKNNVFGHKKIFFRTDVAIDEKTDSVPAVCAEGVVASAVCAARVTAPSVGTGRVAAPSVGTETVVVPDVCAHRVPPAECADSVVAPVVCAGGVALPPATPTSVVTAPALPLASPSATVLQLFLRLPNGQAIPVEIPATPLVSPPSTPPEPPPSTSTQQRHQPSLAKMASLSHYCSITNNRVY